MTDLQNMRNLRMREKLEAGEAVDLSACSRTPEGYYVLDKFIDSMDYCDASGEAWIWSIGRAKDGSNRILASLDPIFYENHDYECLWLR